MPCATAIRVAVSTSGGSFILTVEDDGAGFHPPSAAGPAQGHFGLVSMRDRAMRLSGTLAITSFEYEEDIHRALQAGVSGYLLKESKRSDLMAAIHNVMDGGQALHPTVARLARERAEQPGLSARQLQVLDFVTRGLTNIEIAETLRFTRDGTKRHLHHIHQKLGVSSRAEATLEALRCGLL